MAAPIRLHGYFRSSATWRVRIALALKGLAWESVAHSLLDGEQRDPAYLALNPQGLVPALEIDGLVLTQSMAICEYLDETRPAPPLLPRDAAGRARARALAQAIACDLHPVQNLRVLERIRTLAGSKDAGTAWARETCEQGLDAFAAMVGEGALRFCLGDEPGLADLMLVPQLANARRFGADLRWPRLLEIEANCLALPAFCATAPEVQA
ncbi:maleylacetoacetate isomerase [Novosphingobium huizhouense]|uniref:maleylacetoacetate isomerase n=1 Tax=Novosphingobium huizhouense TaxID=2866625 RepID=UPI001CD8430A|nr:maleylacetoacetate isomerase [Novosphingobium huizhouense]